LVSVSWLSKPAGLTTCYRSCLVTKRLFYHKTVCTTKTPTTAIRENCANYF